MTPEFKSECAELIIIHSYKHKDAAQAMSVGLSSIQRWITQYKQEQKGITPKATTILPR